MTRGTEGLGQHSIRHELEMDLPSLHLLCIYLLSIYLLYRIYYIKIIINESPNM